ncbi:Glycine/D-amino acid oxidase [Pseudooceanicola antarcticus]|uniref:FAD-dependent oxidoreductase n=1 Tax=Pseudooceanicola antarcticus TaxID=1247613 RepID=A0A285HKI2_9RHOB|nr:FAD-dependent oxidoreductase [Pseudooceanicola antarcticus]PJE27883.1 FAD-dependent oxidoreductase [Pseudooceanicola antarcticus]SNY36239.1 Glycine/D-amino acid oxidase [Pseudooceanicola antarcticus]
MASTEVTIRGAGIFGLSCAWACLQRGARVTIVDPHGVGAGSSGGVVGALAPHVPENWNDKKAFQLDSLLMAEEFWTEVQEVSGLSPGYARSGRLQPLADDRAVELARGREATAAELWQGHASWQVIAATGTPWEPVSPSGYLVHDTLTARMHPRQACEALAAACRARGARIVGEAPDAGSVIWATGAAGLEEMSAMAGRQIGVPVKGQAAVLRHTAGQVPQIFAGGVHVVPHADGTVAIGSTSEREFEGLGTDAQLDEVIAAARAAVLVLQGAEVIERWAGLRPRARSRAPMLGPWPERPGHFIANGGFKIGFGMGPKVGQVMADLVLEGHDAIPEGFRAEALF